MANRITTERNGQIGFWISKPGRNVLTAGPNDLMLDLNDKVLQVVDSGFVPSLGGSNSGPTRITIGVNLGFRPFVWGFTTDPANNVSIEYISNTTFDASRGLFAETGFYWLALNVPFQP